MGGGTSKDGEELHIKLGVDDMNYWFVFHPNEHSTLGCTFISNGDKANIKSKQRIKFSFLKLEMHRHVVLEQTK